MYQMLDMILVIGFMLKNTGYKKFCIEQTLYLERRFAIEFTCKIECSWLIKKIHRVIAVIFLSMKK